MDSRTKPLTPLPTDLWGRTAVFLGTGLGIGLMPVMPGTFGSLWGLALAGLFDWLRLGPWVSLGVLAVLLVVGIPICRRAAAHFGADDPGSVVYDEIVALPITFLGTAMTPANAILGFALFRLFDIAKPWPVRRLEKLHGGLGVMIDDIVAAGLAFCVFYVTVHHVLPGVFLTSPAS